MKGNLVIVCRDQDAEAFDHLLAEYGAFQTRLSSTAWYLKLDASPETLQEEILARLGKYTTHYIFEAETVTWNTVDSEAAAALNTLFTE
ncbi:double-stranded DNA-specific endonuclease [Paraburkholderia sp. 2C]